MLDILNTNRSKCRMLCYYMLNETQTNKVVHSSKLSGCFYARFVNFEQTVKSNYGSGFMSSNTYITIETYDNLDNLINLKSNGILCKIKIPSVNKEYIIDDIQIQYDNESIELGNIRYAKKRTILRLNEKCR